MEVNMDYRDIIISYLKHVVSQNKKELKGYFADDAVINWHNTNEQFNTEEFIIANCEYPGNWCGEVERIEQIDNKVIAVSRIWITDMTVSFHVTSFFKFVDGKITVLDEYYSDDGKVPKWRVDKHIGKPIIFD